MNTIKEHYKKIGRMGGKANYKDKSPAYKKRWSMMCNASKRKKHGLPCPKDKDRICYKDDKVYLAGTSCQCHY